MQRDAVLAVLAALEAAQLWVCVDGGWGVDALLGEETRAHADLDLIVRAGDAAQVRAALAALGLRERAGGTPGNFVLENERGPVDVHAVEFDARGFGVWELGDGRIWPFPPAAFAGRGRIGRRDVRCLSADAQVQCHGQGYAPDEHDLRDMERLQERFGVVLPLHLCPRARP